MTEQRALALERAQEARIGAATLRRAIKIAGRRAGAEHAARVAICAESSMRFFQLLQAVPGIGDQNAKQMLSRARINPAARVNAETVDSQRRVLLADQLLNRAKGQSC